MSLAKEKIVTIAKWTLEVPPIDLGMWSHLFGIFKKFFFFGIYISPIYIIVVLLDRPHLLDASTSMYVKLFIIAPINSGIVSSVLIGGFCAIVIISGEIRKKVGSNTDRVAQLEKRVAAEKHLEVRENEDNL